MPTDNQRRWMTEAGKLAQKLSEQHTREFFDQYLGMPPFMPAPTTVPTVYPTLTRRGTVTELKLPGMAPRAAIQLVQALSAATPLRRIDDYLAEFPSGYYDTVRSILVEEFGNVQEFDRTEPEISSAVTPVEIFVEYIGQCRKRDDQKQQTMALCSTCRGTGITPSRSHASLGPACSVCHGSGRSMSVSNSAYASAWVDGGWNARFPEAVLKAFFGEPQAAFDGDFYRYLLSSTDLSKSYKQLARKYHPDMGGRVEQFHKLREAYGTLKDPLMRKRYEAGLRFQEKASTQTNEVVFRVPKSCGRVLVRGQWEALPTYDGTYGGMSRGIGFTQEDSEGRRRLNVTEIVSWSDIFDDRGRLMVARWNSNLNTGKYARAQQRRESRGERPFVVEYEDQEEMVINVTV